MHRVVLYRYLCPVQLYRIFSTQFHKRHDFRENVIECKMCLHFLYNIVLNISHFKKN